MIDLSTDEGIRQAFREIAEWPATVHADSTVTMIRTGGTQRFESPRRDRARQLAAAAAVLLVVVGVVGLITRRDGNQPVADSPSRLVDHGRESVLRGVRPVGRVDRRRDAGLGWLRRRRHSDFATARPIDPRRTRGARSLR